MSTLDASAYLGAHFVRPTDAELTNVSNFDPALYRCRMDNILRGLGYFVLQLTLAAAVNNATVNGLSQVARIPFKVVGIDVGVESAAGTACTGDVKKALAAAPTSFTSMLTAAVDTKTGAGTMQATAITSGTEDVEVGDLLRLTEIGTGAGAVVGSTATLHCFRR